MKKQAKERRESRQNLLLEQFEGDFYQENKVGNEWLIKNWNGDSGKWQVAVYSSESYRRYKEYGEIIRQNNHVRDL